jgi:TRAP-type mannitol/chloroaromatic compound transport system substrate-binding protein
MFTMKISPQITQIYTNFKKNKKNLSNLSNLWASFFHRFWVRLASSGTTMIFVFLLFGVLIFLTGSVAHAQNSNQQGKLYKWKAVSVYPANIPIFNNGIEKFAKDINDASNGQLYVTVFAAREPIEDINKSLEPHDVFDAVSNGTIEIGFGAPVYWTEKVPGCEFMYAVPFGLDEKGMYAWLYKGGGLEIWKELFEPHHIVPFPMGNAGEAMGGWFDRKIEKIEDFNGLNIRMSGFCSEVYRKLGANEIWMVAGEALEAFKQGKINAIVCQGPFHDQDHKFYRGPKYYYYPGWQEPGGVLALIINKKTWDALPGNLKKSIEVVCGNTYQFISNQFESMNARALRELQEKEKVTLIEFPPVVLSRLEKVSVEILEEEAAKNPQFKRVYEAFKKFKQENKAYGWRGNLYGTQKR